jgi:hypothetical protein
MARKKVRLLVKTLSHGDRVVVARDDDGARKGGNVSAERGDEIVWRHAGGTDKAFVVTFVNFESNNPIWPFFGDPDIEASKALLVPVGPSITRKVSAVVPVKYEVAVQDDLGVEALDPMIIVRDRNLNAMLAVGAISALVGVIVTWLVFSNIVAG